MHWSYRDVASFSNNELQRTYSQLSPSRKAHIDRLRPQEDKRRSLAAEILVQELLQSLGITNAVLHRHPNGQPYLTGCDLYVSISHSHQMVACALSADPIGIDIERIKPLDFKICRHLCTEEEKAYCGENLHRLFEIWTAKEAYFKKQGTGITDLKSVNILPLPRQYHRTEDYMICII